MTKPYLVGLSHTSSEEADIYSMRTISTLVRTALLNGGFGQLNRSTPLSDIIQPGMTVLLKPNWVLHYNQANTGMECMVTHPVFIETVLDEVLLAKPGRVIIGDAPIQLCDIHTLVPQYWKDYIKEKARIPIDIKDFRRHIVDGSNLIHGLSESNRSLEEYILFDIGRDSLLEPVTSRGKFRITNYDPRVLNKTHSPGKHQYLLCREAFDADVIISLPKLKTHRKAGITGALKNIVGLIGSKDYLPHHRVGGSALGGDCYPGFGLHKRLVEVSLDIANRRINTPQYKYWSRIGHSLMRLFRRFGAIDIEGGWKGNDTTWRMVLDLNRILIYGQPNATLSSKPLRNIVSITDGVIAGQGNGPLAPEPVELGVVTVATNPAFADLVHTRLMGFDPEKIALIKNAFGKYSHPIVYNQIDECRVVYENEETTVNEAAAKFGTRTKAPIGWDDVW